MSERNRDELRNLTAPEIPMQVTLREALEILKERTFHLPDQHIFNLVDKISEYIYPTDPEH